VSSNKMKNKLVNSMRATKAGTSTADTGSADKKAAPVAEKPAAAEKKAAAPAKKAAPSKKAAAAKPATSGFSSTGRVWPD